MGWYLVYTNSNKEIISERNLINQNFITYMPKYKKVIKHARKLSTVIKPLFPRYLFVKVDHLKQRWSLINHTYGVNSLISMNGEPVFVDQEVINEIKQGENSLGITDMISASYLKKGDDVKIIDGVFSGRKGIFEDLTDNNRVKVLFKLLGKEFTLILAKTSIVK